MTKYARLTNQRLSSEKLSIVPIISLWQKITSQQFTINIVLAGVMIGLGVVYLGVMNSAAKDNLQRHALSKKVDEIRYANHDLELVLSEAQSLQRVSSASEHLELVAATDFQYLDTNDEVALSQ